MDCGCENTCICPSVDCSRESCGPPGCYCDPAIYQLIHYVRENGTCMGSYECTNSDYECCPPCQQNEICVITPQYCPRELCPPPTAYCESLGSSNTNEPTTTSVTSHYCPPGSIWMDCGCENTCNCPSVDCSRESCGPPGCYCDPGKYQLIHYVRENGTCLGSWECTNPDYECCPPCQQNEICVITPQYCPRAPCPPPTAYCEINTNTD